MGTGLGTQAKLGFRGESDNGLVSAVYPTTEATADAEEAVLGSSDLVPFLSESVNEEHQWEFDETLIGVAAINNMDRVGILGSGTIEVQGMYDGLDALIAMAMGFELPNAANSPAAQNGTALTSSGATAAGTWDDSGTPFASGDIGKFIQTLDGGTGAHEGQVRRITAYTDSNTVTIGGANWQTNPVNTDTGTMAQEWLHLFELDNNLHDELFSVMDNDQSWTYPTAGVGGATDLCIRRGTLGIEKNQTKPWIFRSCMVDSMTIKATAGAGVTFSFDLIPFNLDRDSATNTASTTWAFDHGATTLFTPSTNERIVFSDITQFWIDDYSASVSLSSADAYAVSEFTITLNNNLKVDDQDAVSTSWRTAPARGGFREITGSFTLPRYDSDTLITDLNAGNILMAHIKFQGSTIASSARYFEIYICSLKLTSVSAPVSGADVISLTFNFRALVPAAQPSGFPTQNQDAPRSEMMIRTLNQNPYNIFRDQQREY